MRMNMNNISNQINMIIFNEMIYYMWRLLNTTQRYVAHREQSLIIIKKVIKSLKEKYLNERVEWRITELNSSTFHLTSVS